MNDSKNIAGQHLTFFIAGEEYALNIMQVTDIIECGAVTKVPGAPPWIRGVHNLRGSVIPVVDLAIKFGLAPTEITRRTCIVIVEINVDHERLLMGVMADSVHQVIDLDASQIQPPPSFGPKVRVDCILGMGVGESKFVLLLDIEKVLTSNELLAAKSVLSDEIDDAEIATAVASGE
jgi:purine-binding chemotaxis protein CheW